MEKNPIKAQRLIASKSSKQSVKFFLKSLSETNDETKINNDCIGHSKHTGFHFFQIMKSALFCNGKKYIFQ